MEAYSFIFKAIIGAVITFLLLGTMCCQGQNNPWKTELKGNNPWGSSSDKSVSTKENPINKPYELNTDSVAIELSKIFTNDSSISDAQRTDIKDFVVRNSKDTVVYFIINDTIIKLNTNSRKYYKRLRQKGKESHKAGIALGMGIGSATLLNFFALPFNLVGSAIPTRKTRTIIKQFATDNPHATKKEVNAFRMGISGKRFNNSFTGVAYGTVANIALLMTIGTGVLFISI